jgi:hypothetical protein
MYGVWQRPIEHGRNLATHLPDRTASMVTDAPSHHRKYLNLLRQRAGMGALTPKTSKWRHLLHRRAPSGHFSSQMHRRTAISASSRQSRHYFQRCH